MTTPKIISFSLQIILWFLFLTAPFYKDHKFSFNNTTFIITYSLQHLIYVCLFYYNYFYVIPKKLYKKNLTHYVLFIFTLLTITYFISHLLKYIFFKHYSFIHHYSEPIVPLIQVTAVSIAFKLLIDQIENSLNKKIVLEEKTKAELNYLRSQINPHFLFNTLNNITALIHINPDKAEQSVIKLSKIMRAILNSGTQQKIELINEIEILNSYIDLQKIRLNEDTQLNYSVIGNIKSLLIEPLILINFIENVFKHGIGEGKNIITINISVIENLLHLTTENKITSGKKDDTSGIGLVNVKKRLNIVYKDKYRLTIDSSNNIYKVNLVLELT